MDRISNAQAQTNAVLLTVFINIIAVATNITRECFIVLAVQENSPGPMKIIVESIALIKLCNLGRLRSRKMNVAYLILAHAYPELLARLIRRLDHPHAAFFVHVDAKSDLDAFVGAVANPKVVFLIGTDRTSINWCGFSMVRATMNLLMCSAATTADRFVLLSGTDYPTASASSVVAILSQDKEFIQVDRVLDPDGDGEFDRCANRIFLGDMSVFNPRSGNRILKGIANRMTRRLPRRRRITAVYYGSSWWTLTRKAVVEILNVYRDAPGQINQFRFTRSPDEMVFQTLLKSSDRAGHIAYDSTVAGFTPAENQAANHYANWSRPNPLAPRTVDEEDYEEIVSSGALFVRKIDPVRSAGLLAKLDLLAESRPSFARSA